MDELERAKFLRVIDEMESRVNELGALGTRPGSLPHHAAIYRAEILLVIASAQSLLNQVANEPLSTNGVRH